MNVLVLGSGGREHALSWKIAQSTILDDLYIAPGNAGTGDVGINVNLDIMNFKKIKDFVLEKNIKIVVVGPEAPLVEGIKDYFDSVKELENVAIIGPSKKGAQLEGSKDFAKRFMKAHRIPTAKYESVTKSSISKGNAFLASMKPPYVLKCDGLAAGKGVVILDNLKDAKKMLKDILVNKKFGDAGKKVVIEQFLKGEEVSMFVITDGNSYKILPEAKDYKRIGEGDTGLNTGGMGAVSPVPLVNREFMEKTINQIIIPTIKGIKKDKLDYKGFIFFGLIKVGSDPYVIEYNVRMGDPETEVVMPRIKSDLLELMEGVATNTLSECDLEISEKSAATVMMVSGGYPEAYKKGKEITGLNDQDDTLIFHSGTTIKNDIVVSNGGRVLAVTAIANNLENSLKNVYKSIENIKFQNSNFRTDIGADVISKIEKK